MLCVGIIVMRDMCHIHRCSSTTIARGVEWEMQHYISVLSKEEVRDLLDYLCTG